MKTAIGMIILMPLLVMAQQFNRDKGAKRHSASGKQDGIRFRYSNWPTQALCHLLLHEIKSIEKKLTVDGDIPYGVNYITASDETVRLTLSARDEYETGYLMVCLADTKNAISAASKRD